MWRFFARTHALRNLQLLPARTSHARVLFALSHSAPAPQNFFKDEMELKVQRQVHWGGINRLFIWRPKHYFNYFYEIPQRWRSKFRFSIEKLLFWVSFSSFYSKISSVIAHVWRTHQTMHARTFARTIPWSFAPPSHLDFRTHACDARTHVRTLTLWYVPMYICRYAEKFLTKNV